MNSQQNCLKLDERIIKLSINTNENPFQGKYLSARSYFDGPITEEVTYQNRIFNIKKKFTVPSPVNQSLPKRRASIINQDKIRAKPSEVFAKYSDNIVKNRRLLRRGVWQIPFEPDTIAEVKRSRYKTEKQQSPKSSEQQVLFRSGEQKSTKGQSTRDLLESRQQQLPTLRSSQEIGLPIRLSTRYGSKPLSCKTTEVDECRQVRNAMSRKLAVELINYSLLGKWASSSLKI